MSTPSTAFAPAPIDIANPYSYASYSHHPHFTHTHVNYLPSPLANGSGPGPSHLVPNTLPAPRISNPVPRAAMPTVPSRTQRQSLPRNKRRRDASHWDEFYKNGKPKEVIVIDDSDDDQASSSRRQSGYQSGASTTRHADKRRKTQTGQSSFAPVYSQHQPSYSATQTPHLNGYQSPTTVSASSTASVNPLHSTAGTSLGSNVGSYAAPVANGTKRKRVTRATVAAQSTIDAFAHYHPPPNPPIKAKEVYVQPIADHDNYGGKVDDNDGHFIVTPDTDLTPRYKITKLLGQGTFGKVVEAVDRNKKSRVAIKVIRSVQKYRDASRIELRVLSTLKSNDQDNRNKCIHLRDCFDYKNHICIVTDLLGMSVFDFLKANSFAPFPNSHIQSFARQLLTSVAFLHDLNLIHTDLKPENILLVNNQYQHFSYNRQIPSSTTTNTRTGRTRKVLHDTDIRLIDFGSATFDDEYHSSVVSTRHYRAPEIILGLGWSFPCDIWSIGCILVEFFTGDALFQTHDNLEHLAMMQQVVGGKINSQLVRQIVGRGSASSSSAAKYFRNQKLDYPNNESSRASRKYVNAMKPLGEILPPPGIPNSPFFKQFLDLLRKIFVYDPNKRITAKEALKHPWFREVVSDEGVEIVRSVQEREQQRPRY